VCCHQGFLFAEIWALKHYLALNLFGLEKWVVLRQTLLGSSGHWAVE
jgi:hypothetical protein